MNPSKQLTHIAFSKTGCGVDFYLNTDTQEKLKGFLTEYTPFKTDFFEFFFFKKAKGYIILNHRKIELRPSMLLIVSPHQQQEWYVDEAELEYTFLIFREDFMRTFIADKYFVYRLHYCHSTNTAPYIMMPQEQETQYREILTHMKRELLQPVADSYHIIVSQLYYFLSLVNRHYAKAWNLPECIPKNNYAFQLKELMEQHIHQFQRINDYAEMMHISRVTLNAAVVAQFGVTANQLLKQRLTEEIKNEYLFSGKSISQIAYEFNFPEPSHLMRFFKKQTGKTFTQYLRDYQRGIYE